ncbi:GHMP kinase [Candidatus Bathyarchaeota archaeon]|nr:GHMP kinase [Candidatus Bathyarchaeota archaeon]
MGIRSKAPFRIAFAGGGTDVAPYCDEFKGAVLNATINYYAYVTITNSKDKGIHVNSLDYNEFKSFYREDDLDNSGPLGLVKATLREIQEHDEIDILNGSGGMNVFIHSDAPPGSGLGSSSTVCVALLGALLDYFKIPLTRYEIAEKSFDIERNKLGIKGGSQDQFAATFGGFNYMEFFKENTIVNPLRINNDIMNELQYNTILVNTGKSRMSDNILEEQVRLYKTEREEILPHYHRAVELTNEIKNCLLRQDLEKFADLLSEAFHNKARFCDKIATPRVMEVYNMAMEHGALGGRILGAGGGGFMMFYVNYLEKRNLIKALQGIQVDFLNFSFDTQGLQTWKI